MDQPKAQTQERRKATPLLASCVIFLVALNLRPAIVAVGPLLSSIGTTFGWGESLQGLLGSLPLLAFALFSMIVGALTAKLDSNKVLLWALIALAGGCIVRSLSSESMVWLGTLVIGASIAVGPPSLSATTSLTYLLQLEPIPPALLQAQHLPA